MQSNIQQAYLIRDEKNAGANTATRVGTLFAALCTDVAQHGTDITELGKDIAALTPATVDISDGFAPLDDIHGSGKAGIYQLIFASNNAGWMLVGGDGMLMMTTQTVIGLFAVKAGALAMNPTGKPTVLTRKMITMPDGEQQIGWTEWNDLGEEMGGGTTSAYPAVADWSGETVAGAAVTTQSVQGVEGTVVYDTTRRTFLLRVATTLPVKYYNNWEGREALQANAWTQAAGGGFTAGFFANTIYRGADGSVWVATADDTIEAVVTPPDTSPYVLPAALTQSSWQMSALPDKAELVNAWKAGRPIRTSIGTTVELQVSDTMEAVVMTVHWPNFAVATVTYRGTATGWGYDAMPWTVYQIPATAALSLDKTETQSGNE